MAFVPGFTTSAGAQMGMPRAAPGMREARTVVRRGVIRCQELRPTWDSEYRQRHIRRGPWSTTPAANRTPISPPNTTRPRATPPAADSPANPNPRPAGSEAWTSSAAGPRCRTNLANHFAFGGFRASARRFARKVRGMPLRAAEGSVVSDARTDGVSRRSGWGPAPSESGL